MSYPTVTLESGQQLLKHHREETLDEIVLDDLTELKDGDDIDAEMIIDLSNAVFETCHRLERESMRDRGAAFERKVAPITHEKLQLSPIHAGDPGFWRWLTFSHSGAFADIVDWRYGTSTVAREEYFGLGAIKQGLFAYLWLRANAVYDPKSSNSYVLASRGDVDIWQSHIVRIDFGSMPAMARAFITFVHPEPDEQHLSREEYRALASELTRRNASLVLELFDDEAANEFVSNIWAERDAWMLEN